MSYKNRKFKRRRNVTGQAVNDDNGSPHDKISKYPTVINDSYCSHFRADEMQHMYDAVNH